MQKTYLLIIFSLFIFPTSVISNLYTPVGSGGFDNFIVSLLISFMLAILFVKKKHIDKKIIIILFLILSTYFLFLAKTIIIDSGSDVHAIISDSLPYLYWFALLFPFIFGHIKNWEYFIKFTTLIIIVSASVSFYALFFDSNLFSLLIGKDEAMAEYHKKNIFRLPFAHGYIIPFLISSWIMIIKHNQKKNYIAFFIIIILTTILLLGQNRTVIIALFLSLIFFTGKIKLIPTIRKIMLLVFLTSISFVVINQYKDGLLAPVYNRLVVGAVNINETLDNAVTGNRDLLYQYTITTLETKPFFGRGFGNDYFNEIGRPITRQDISISNHIDKTGLVGVFIFLTLHIYLWGLVRNNLWHTKKSNTLLEYNLRKIFILQIPLFFLISLNIDILYGYTFLFLFILLHASIIAEGKNFKKGETS